MNSGICANAYDGVLGIFIVQLLTAAFLFFSLFGAIHFYEMWYPTHVMEGFGQADDEEGVLVVPFSAEYSTDKSSKLIVAKYEPVTSDTVYNDGYAQAATGGDSFYYSQPIAGNVQYNDQQQQYDQSGNYDQSSGYYSGGYDQPAGNTSSYPVEPAHYPSNHYSTYGNNYPAEEAI